FALFYLRGIAPKEVKSSDIYWGAIPWIVLQLMLVALLVAFPELVTYFLDKPVLQDLNNIQIDLPALGGGLEGAPDMGLPALGLPPAVPAPTP
ncbi:MAG: C4-dicarboxylate ABC transporter, partial [Notoacmeibacter sp.]